jgi:hypothetical protein
MRTPKIIDLFPLNDRAGVVLILVALLLVVFLAFTALAVDISHLYAVRNELQNASDAGALAGARVLYCPPSCYPECNPDTCSSYALSVNSLANDMAGNMALNNKSENVIVEAAWDTAGNSGDVERGHWTFSTRTFTANPSLAVIGLSGVSFSDLDTNPNFINAVRVTTRRQATQADSFFSRILGYTGFSLDAQAVAYIGFAGRLNPTEADQPIAICKQSIVDALGNYNCNIGRMLNSGSNSETHNTAAWTNFTTTCATANQPTVSPLICGSGNTLPVVFGTTIGSTGGVVDPLITGLRDCFGPTTRTDPWAMTLPVIDCPGNNPGNCSTVLGAVTINIVWISNNAVDLGKSNTESKFAAEDFPPSHMGDWTPTFSTRAENWADFVDHFNLKNVDNVGVTTYDKKSIYFLPSCEPVDPSGPSGGPNFGVLARYPALVD